MAELKLSMERFIATMRRPVEALREADTFSTAEVEAVINAKDRENRRGR